MVAISFSVLKSKILSGEKRQTIRLFGKKWSRAYIKWMIGKDIYLQLYWNQRSKNNEKLGEQLCKEMILTYLDEITVEIAKDDGFDSLEECQEWFQKTYPYIELEAQPLIIIKW